MFDSILFCSSVRGLQAFEIDPTLEPEDTEGNSINDPNPSGNPNEDQPTDSPQ